MYSKCKSFRKANTEINLLEKLTNMLTVGDVNTNVYLMED